MSVVSFPGYNPPPRYDDSPWIEARLEESATQGGTYTTTETFTLDPVDDDPGNPEPRSFTTTLGTDDLYYRFVWVDADLNESAPTIGAQNTNGTVPGSVAAFVTAAELAAILHVNAAANSTALDRVLAASAFEICEETGRNDFTGAELSLAEQVNLARAEELWKQMKAPFGIIGLDAELGPTRIARDTWERHAHALAPLKRVWGIA